MFLLDSVLVPDYQKVLKAEGSQWKAQKWLNLTLDQCVETRSHDCRVVAGKNYEPSPIVSLYVQEVA